MSIEKQQWATNRALGNTTIKMYTFIWTHQFLRTRLLIQTKKKHVYYIELPNSDAILRSCLPFNSMSTSHGLRHHSIIPTTTTTTTYGRHRLHLGLLGSGWSMRPLQIIGFSSHLAFLVFPWRSQTKQQRSANSSVFCSQCSLPPSQGGIASQNHLREAPRINTEAPTFKEQTLAKI